MATIRSNAQYMHPLTTEEKTRLSALRAEFGKPEIVRIQVGDMVPDIPTKPGHLALLFEGHGPPPKGELLVIGKAILSFPDEPWIYPMNITDLLNELVKLAPNAICGEPNSEITIPRVMAIGKTLALIGGSHMLATALEVCIPDKRVRSEVEVVMDDLENDGSNKWWGPTRG